MILHLSETIALPYVRSIPPVIACTSYNHLRTERSNTCLKYASGSPPWPKATSRDGKHGHTEPIQTFRCQACRTTFTSRRNTPLYRLKTPWQQVAMVLSALGSWAGLIRGLAGLRLSTSHDHQPFSRAAFEHAQTLHKHSFSHLQLPHVQLDELRTRLRSCTQVLWLAIDPRTKILPVLQLGPRTQPMAHQLIHSLRQMLAAFLLADLHE